jgi:AmiR/NasT family two-component response regulator
VAIAAEVNRGHAKHLKRALATNRDIGVAIRVLMARPQLTREQAFDLLRVASQKWNRKLHDIAVEVGDSGTLAL